MSIQTSPFLTVRITKTKVIWASVKNTQKELLQVVTCLHHLPDVQSTINPDTRLRWERQCKKNNRLIKIASIHRSALVSFDPLDFSVQKEEKKLKLRLKNVQLKV